MGSLVLEKTKRKHLVLWGKSLEKVICFAFFSRLVSKRYGWRKCWLSRNSSLSFYWKKKKPTTSQTFYKPIYKISSIPSDFEVEKEKCFRPTRAFGGSSSCQKLIIVNRGSRRDCRAERSVKAEWARGGGSFVSRSLFWAPPPHTEREYSSSCFCGSRSPPKRALPAVTRI